MRTLRSHIALHVALPSVLCALLVAGCGRGADGASSTSATVTVACTTSVLDSGLLDALVAAFERASPAVDVKVVAVGTGEALELGRRKDADVLIVHAKEDEERFVAEGHGIERRDLMQNDFVIVGPPDDPAGVRGAPDAASAMRAIAESKAPFISRGDRSGTHARELALWQAAGVPTPTPATDPWYGSAGQGMGEVLAIASETGAYTLTDSATFRAMRSTLDLDIVWEGDAPLTNVYGVVLVAGSPEPGAARAFFDWLTSPAATDLIRSFGAQEYGEPLFVPIAGS